MFEALGRVIYRRRRWVVAASLAFVVFAGVWGTGVFAHLTGGGFEDPHSESSRAAEVAFQELGRDSADVVVLYRSADATVDDPAFEAAVTGSLAALPQALLERTTTFYGTHAPQLVSTDRHATYAVLQLRRRRPGRRDRHDRGRPRRAGPADADRRQRRGRPRHQRPRQRRHRPRRVDLDADPGGPAGDHLRLAGLGRPAAGDRRHRDPRRLHGAARVLHVHRRVGVRDQHRDDHRARAWRSTTACSWSAGSARRSAARRTSRRRWPARWPPPAGRSRSPGVTVAVSLAGLLIFPQVFLRSMGFGGMSAVLVAMLAALTLLPALLAMLGPKVDALSVRPWLRRVFRRPVRARRHGDHPARAPGTGSRTASCAGRSSTRSWSSPCSSRSPCRSCGCSSAGSTSGRCRPTRRAASSPRRSSATSRRARRGRSRRS